MKAPIPMRTIRGRTTAPFRVNDRPDVLDKVYENLMGREGPTMLSDETKWLAVTHKSFDHGRRGFNDRLAFIGKILQRKCWGTREMLMDGQARG